MSNKDTVKVIDKLGKDGLMEVLERYKTIQKKLTSTKGKKRLGLSVSNSSFVFDLGVQQLENLGGGSCCCCCCCCCYQVKVMSTPSPRPKTGVSQKFGHMSKLQVGRVFLSHTFSKKKFGHEFSGQVGQILMSIPIKVQQSHSSPSILRRKS